MSFLTRAQASRLADAYARFDPVLSVGLRSGRGGPILQVDLTGGSAWRIPIAFES
jgi:hypothetical protein